MTTAIQSPGGYAASRAVAFAAADGSALLVSAAQPLPVVVSAGTAAPTPLTGTTTAALQAGPFEPMAGRPVTLVLHGEWTGTVRLLRSADAGLTKVPVTLGGSEWGVFGANCCEPVWEEHEAGAQLYLDIAPTLGTLMYRLAQ